MFCAKWSQDKPVKPASLSIIFIASFLCDIGRWPSTSPVMMKSAPISFIYLPAALKIFMRQSIQGFIFFTITMFGFLYYLQKTVGRIYNLYGYTEFFRNFYRFQFTTTFGCTKAKDGSESQGNNIDTLLLDHMYGQGTVQPSR